jgi:hypothetical protein
MRSFVLLTGLVTVCLVPAVGRADSSAEAVAFFEKQVRPVLAERCFSCHGPKVQRGGLRLDSRDGLLKGGDTGPTVVPGQPEKSLLLQAVRRNADLKMPPKEALPAPAVAALENWVRLGAPWPADAPAGVIVSGITEARRAHWAFRPVGRPTPPVNRNATGSRNPIDRFVLARLEERGLSPSPEADARALIRRVTFDLIGLPPTPEEVRNFVEDHSPNAYEKLVDRLLASPAYGERWGRHWLDVARYADTKGYVFNEERRYPYAYTYRDYVIRSFNEDRPYDRFILEQLAADRLENAGDRQALAAMGYLTLGRRFLNNIHDIIDDRIDVTMRGLQGLTVGCARCHDHKFDPIPSRDYYSLYGIFASSVEPKDLPLIAPPEHTSALAAFEKELKVREGAVQEYLTARQGEVKATLRARTADYLLAASFASGSRGEGSDLNRALLVRWRLHLAETRKNHHPVLAPWHALAALAEKEFATRAPALLAEFTANKTAGKPINPLVARFFAGKRPANLKEVAVGYAALLAEAARGTGSDHVAIREALGAPSDIPAGEIERFFNVAQRNELVARRKKVELWKATAPGAPPRAMVLNDSGSPVNPYVFVRGNPANHGVSVPRQYLEVVAGETRKPFKEGSGRLELARSIVSKDNPLTARVMVNRVWLHHFGKGIVTTPSDFGLRGEKPSHPELLDWLAGNFMDNDWSVKKLHRLIVTSMTYRQTTGDNPAARNLDPENSLLWRMNRRRLEFEAMRDSLLAVAGRLDRTMGGTAVDITVAPFPPRRSVYGFIERQNLPGLFRTFDLASPDTSTPQRFTTTVPQQALFLMNSPFAMEQARAFLARSDVADLKGDRARVEQMYQLAYGRSAEPEEIALALEFVNRVGSKNAPGVPTGWEQYAQVLLLGNEFAFVD